VAKADRRAGRIDLPKRALRCLKRVVPSCGIGAVAGRNFRRAVAFQNSECVLYLFLLAELTSLFRKCVAGMAKGKERA